MAMPFSMQNTIEPRMKPILLLTIAKNNKINALLC